MKWLLLGVGSLLFSLLGMVLLLPFCSYTVPVGELGLMHVCAEQQQPGGSQVLDEKLLDGLLTEEGWHCELGPADARSVQLRLVRPGTLWTVIIHGRSFTTLCRVHAGELQDMELFTIDRVEQSGCLLGLWTRRLSSDACFTVVEQAFLPGLRSRLLQH